MTRKEPEEMGLGAIVQELMTINSIHLFYTLHRPDLAAAILARDYSNRQSAVSLRERKLYTEIDRREKEFYCK